MDAAEGVGPDVVVLGGGGGAGAGAEGAGRARDGLEVAADGEDGLAGLGARARRGQEDQVRGQRVVVEEVVDEPLADAEADAAVSGAGVG